MKDPLTLEELRSALGSAFSRDHEANDEWIKQMAEFILDFFGFEEYVLDNALTPRDRDIFYILENVGLLKTVMEETTIQKGKTWRIHYWILNREKIRSLYSQPGVEEGVQQENGDGTIYNGLSDKVWTRR
jgi:hypothetical protein